MLDLVNFWEVVVFSWITGNSDMHLKNFSLISRTPGQYVLSELPVIHENTTTSQKLTRSNIGTEE